MLLRSYVNQINETFQEIMPGIKTYGLSQSIIRTQGTERELLPGIVGKDGEIQYVGFDDVSPVSLYHRNAGITISRSPRSGTGDDPSDIINTYQMVMVVFINHKASKLFPEELFLYLQANMPEALKSDPYKTIFIRITNVILNSQLVFQGEYAGAEFTLPPEKSLFQINYTIETTFKKKCFEKCPEDC